MKQWMDSAIEKIFYIYQQGIIIYIKIKNLLIDVGLDPKNRISIGTDGAHNMTWNLKGVFCLF